MKNCCRVIANVLVLLLLFSAPLRAQKLVQVIKGKVVDNETQMPLIGASVCVQLADPSLCGVTDMNGDFRITEVPIGRYNLRISYIGYDSTLVPEVLVSSAKEVELNVGLKQSVNQLKSITVRSPKDKPLNTMAMISARSFTVEETRRYAGGLDDPARMASAFAGVAVGNVQDNGIVVRGNSPKGVSWRLEGVDIANPNHFAGGNMVGGGAVTIFSSQMMSNSDFYTGAFPAEYGNALAGVFDMKLRTGNNEKYEHAIQLGLLGIDISSEGPICKKSGSSYLFNYRYSTTGLFSKVGLLTTDEVPKYQDFSFKLNFPTRRAGTFALWGIGGLDKNENPYEQDSAKWKYNIDRQTYKSNQEMGACGLSHKYKLNKQTYTNTSIAATGATNEWIFNRLDDNLVPRPDTYLRNNSGKVMLSSVINYKFNAANMLRVGFCHNLMYYNLKMSTTEEENEPATYHTFVDEKASTSLTEIYAQHKYDITSNLNISGGLHFNYFALSGKHSFEPRFAVKWQATQNQAFSFGYGNHSQLEELRIYRVHYMVNGKDYYPNQSLDFSKAHHFVLGYDWAISKKLRFKAEPYFQYLYHVPGIRDSSFSMINFTQDETFRDSLVNNCEGRNIGVDFTLERFMNDNYYYLMTVSLFSSKYKAGDGVWRSTRFNKGYVMNLVMGKEFFRKNNRVFGVNGRLNILGGDHYTPYTADEETKDVLYDQTKAFDKQFKPVYYLDLTLTYKINKRKYSTTWALQIKNLLCTPINAGFYYNYQTKKVDEYDITMILPVLSYKIDF
jgi:hypothetical protein